MTDKELLEAAAKAAGIKGTYRTEAVIISGDWFDVTAIFYDDGSGWWNPLDRDEDAFHLVETFDLAVWSRGFVGGMWRVSTKYGNNYQSVDLRRAIVMAAAGRPTDTKKATAKEALQAVLALDEKGAILSTSGRSEEFHAAMQLVHKALT